MTDLKPRRSPTALPPSLAPKGGKHERWTLPIALLYILILSSTFVSIKIGLKYSPPMTLLSIRFLLAGAITALLARSINATWPATRQAWLRLAGLGIVNTMLPATLNFFAMNQVSVGMAAIVMSTNPLLLTLIAPWLLGERLTPARIVGLLCGFGGVVFVMIVRVGAGRPDTPLGVLLLLCGATSMVGGTFLFKRFPPRENLIVVNSVQHLVAGLALVPLVAVAEDPTRVRFTLPLLGALAYMGLLMSVGATLLWFWLLSRGEASAASSFYFLSPVSGIILGATLLHEKLGWREVVGLFVICIGIFLIRRTGKAPMAGAAPVGLSTATAGTKRPPPP
jgi:drug/metabolite transporter (DMT)-like permease